MSSVVLGTIHGIEERASAVMDLMQEGSRGTFVIPVAKNTDSRVADYEARHVECIRSRVMTHTRIRTAIHAAACVASEMLEPGHRFTEVS